MDVELAIITASSKTYTEIRAILKAFDKTVIVAVVVAVVAVVL